MTATKDLYDGQSYISSQGESWVAVTPSDTADLAAGVPKWLWCNVGGNIAINGKDDLPCTFAVFAGQIIPLRPKRVLSTGTTATGITAVY